MVSPNNKWNATNNLIRNSKAITTQWKTPFPFISLQASLPRQCSREANSGKHRLPWNAILLEDLHCLQSCYGDWFSLCSRKHPWYQMGQLGSLSFPSLFVLCCSSSLIAVGHFRHIVIKKYVSWSIRRCTQEIWNDNIQNRHILSWTETLNDFYNSYFFWPQISHLWNTKCLVCPDFNVLQQ